MQVRIQAFDPQLALPTVRMWRRSFEAAMGLPRSNGPDEVYQDQLAFLQTSYADHELTHVLHQRSPRVLGFMAQSQQQISHLYLCESIQGQGVGTRLLQLAKQRSPQGLKLYTFQDNVRARQFYAQFGFVETAFGTAPKADNPWATRAGQLADVLLCWRPESA